MHKIRNGIVSLGSIHVPVGVCTAAKEKEKKFRSLHKECGNPISQPRCCPTCQKDNLEFGEVVPGFEFSKGNFVVLDPAEMEKIIPMRTEVIQLNKFVRWGEVDELYFSSHYFLQPASVVTRPYELLAASLGDHGACGIGRSALWGKEWPTMLWARPSGAMMMTVLHCYEDVAHDETSIVDELSLVPEEQQELSDLLVTTMIRPFVPEEDLVSQQRKDTDLYLDFLLRGEQFDFPNKDDLPSMTTDVMAAFEQTLAWAREQS